MYIPPFSALHLLGNLCISILEFKSAKKIKGYQDEQAFMYFYIRI